MKAKRSSPATGPLLTFALMIASVAAVGAVARYLDSPKDASAPAFISSSSSERAQTGTQR